MNSIMWQPTCTDQSQMSEFMRQKGFSSYHELYDDSIQPPSSTHTFWRDVLDFYSILYEGDSSIITGPQNSFFNYSWFPSLKLNFAENLLAKGQDDHIALTFESESGMTRQISYQQLRLEVARFQDNIKDIVVQGDVVAAYMPNIIETVIAMLGTTSLGGVFTSMSCDFGVDSVLNRFVQTRPKVLVTANGYTYNGQRYDLINNIQKIIPQLKHLQKVIIVDFLKTNHFKKKIKASIPIDIWEEAVSSRSQIKAKDLKFKRVPFKSPLYIMYSSGTTGKPKCIVHSVGGTLLQHVKELGLHCDFSENKTIFYFTTCAWMMWNWLISGLFFGGTVCLFEGSPKCPSVWHFFEMINRKGIHIFGTSPKFLSILKDSGYHHNIALPTLQTILSTGSPLSEDLFDFVYKSIKSDVMLSSIAGGTDILSCFMLGNPLLPVYKGEITCKGLGMDIVAFDLQGQATVEKQGELVCRQSFPSQPVLDIFPNDRENYQKAYFLKYPNVWCHGDQIRISHKGTIRIFGRSDATLNPGGVRIGTAEIYNVVESLENIEDSLCIGRNWQGDVQILLFVKLNKNISLDQKFEDFIRHEIKKRLTVRHLPAYIFQVGAIPYTRNGKKMEILIRNLFDQNPAQQQDLPDIEAVADPQCLKQYKEIATTI